MKAKDIKTFTQAQQYCEGLLNDFETGISTKEESLKLLKEYTEAIHDLFFERAKREVKINPDFFETYNNRSQVVIEN